MNIEAVIPIVLLLLVGAVVYLSKKAKIKVTKDSIEVESSQMSKTEVSKISNSEVEVVSGDSKNVSVKEVVDNSKIKIT